MTKLEEKLIQLGYEEREYNRFHHIYDKEIGGHKLTLYIDDNGKIVINQVIPYKHFTARFQVNIDSLQQAFNQLQKDLEVLGK